MRKVAYDVEERLLKYWVRIIKVVEQPPNTKPCIHVVWQLLRPVICNLVIF
jgi:hypothetical protein